MVATSRHELATFFIYFIVKEDKSVFSTGTIWHYSKNSNFAQCTVMFSSGGSCI